MASVAEVGSDIYRINVEIPGKPVTFSLFLIKDEQPTLIETSYRRVFDEVIDAVATVIDPSTLRHVVIPHFEGDECGGLNLFLEAAPHAAPVCSPIGANTSIPDFSIREPLRVDEETILDLGQHKLRFLVTPYVHAWDSLLAYDDDDRDPVLLRSFPPTRNRSGADRPRHQRGDGGLHPIPRAVPVPGPPGGGAGQNRGVAAR